jgi:hypothetical protein
MVTVTEKTARNRSPGETSGSSGPPVTRALVGAVIGSNATDVVDLRGEDLRVAIPLTEAHLDPPSAALQHERLVVRGAVYASSNVRSPSGPEGMRTSSLASVGSIRSSSTSRSRTGIDPAQAARSGSGSRRYGWKPNDTGTGAVPVGVTVVATVSVGPARVTFQSQFVRERERGE